MTTDNTHNLTIAVIGGGAAGLLAAAAAGRAGCRVLLFDSNDRLGRKIYATGNGRCNLTNYRMEDECYNTPVLHLMRQFDGRALMDYFRDLGVYLHDRDGYVYPRTDQAATIVDALVRNIRMCGNVVIHTGERVTGIVPMPASGSSPVFRITTGAGSYTAHRVILAAGGRVSKAFGCHGDGYRLAETFGHSVTTLSPGLVPVMVEDPMLRIMSGVRCLAIVNAYVDGEEVYADAGELQITDTGFSGIPTFQCSRWISQALSGGHRTQIGIDFLPEFLEEQLREEIMRRQQSANVIYVSDVFAGLVHSKIGSYIARSNGLADEKKLARLENRGAVIEDLLLQLGNRRYTVTGTAGYDKAQVTAGGVPLGEVDETFQSRFTRGVYLAGELLDVDGICGGYNLTWAMCSGYLAGMHAAEGDSLS